MHTFACRGCEQQIGFALDLNHENAGVGYSDFIDSELVEDGPPDCPVVNLEADFLIPAAQQGRDGTFARLGQIQQIVREREKNGEIVGAPPGQFGALAGDAKTEWLDVRKAWTLTRAGQLPLARAKVKAGSDRYHPSAPVENLQQWLFPFLMTIGGAPLEANLGALADTLKPLIQNDEFERLLDHYDAELVRGRGRIYLDVLNGFFNAYDDFGQLMPRFSAGLSFDEDLAVSSGDFERTKMFYGNTFEALGTVVDLIAFSNNILGGRRWEQFQSMDAARYMTLDKIARFNPFAGTPAFAKLSVETDNQLRNASHHGSIEINQRGDVISYRVGKSSQGELVSMTYTKYLERCITLLMQLISVFCLELVLTQHRKMQPF
ncbi:hypothetical protein ACC697_04065 [Rhizobium ruizarguesonis]